MYNVYQDITYVQNRSIGNTVADQRMLVVKYWGDLTINSGVTVTAAARKKGMYIHVVGKLTNNGAISMTSRGAIAAGQNVYLLKNGETAYHYIPAAGGAGGAQLYYRSTKTANTDQSVHGNVGGAGTNRGTGGGGSGAICARRADYGSFTRYSGAGSAGTSYSGGSGGGGIDTNYSGTYSSGAGAANGGAGGQGLALRGRSSWYARNARRRSTETQEALEDIMLVVKQQEVQLDIMDKVEPEGY